MAKHKYYKCSNGKCISEGFCNFCEGGLLACIVCGGAESSLTNDCVGRPLRNAEEESISKGRLDFENGRWVKV